MVEKIDGYSKWMNERMTDWMNEWMNEWNTGINGCCTVDCRYNKNTVSNNEPTKQLVCSNLLRDSLHLAEEQWSSKLLGKHQRHVLQLDKFFRFLSDSSPKVGYVLTVLTCLRFFPIWFLQSWSTYQLTTHNHTCNMLTKNFCSSSPRRTLLWCWASHPNAAASCGRLAKFPQVVMLQLWEI